MAKNDVPKNVWIFWSSVFSGLSVWFIGTRLLNDEYGYLQALILALTLIAVVVYTIDTRRMQQAMVKQTNLSILPVFVVHLGAKRIEVDNRRYDVMELENIGNGVALNILIDTIRIVWAEKGTEHVWPNARIILNPLMAIKPAERVMVEHQSIYGPADTVLERMYDLMDKLDSKADKDYELKIRFSDVLGNRYVQTIYVGKTGNWPGSVVEDDAGLSIRAAFTNNPFLHSPLRQLRRRRPLVVERH